MTWHVNIMTNVQNHVDNFMLLSLMFWLVGTHMFLQCYAKLQINFEFFCVAQLLVLKYTFTI